MDVFSSFLVTLDFPWHKLTLGPLPPYPGTAARSVLNTEQESLRPTRATNVCFGDGSAKDTKVPAHRSRVHTTAISHRRCRTGRVSIVSATI